jgi:hypothetical protein
LVISNSVGDPDPDLDPDSQDQQFLGLPDPDPLVRGSVADPDPGSGAFLTLDPDPGSGAFLTLDPDPGSGIGFFPDPGSRIPTPYFLELSDKFLAEKSLKTGPNFFLQHLKNKIIFNFLKFVATKKGLTTNFFSPLSFVVVLFLDPGSGMDKNQDPGSGINIPDPQHLSEVRIRIRLRILPLCSAD